MAKDGCSKLGRAWRQTEGSLNRAVSSSRAGRYFKLEARKTTFTREVRAGLATFLTMVYIIAVNATILTDSGGPCAVHSDASYQHCLLETKSDLVVATAAAAAIGSLSMGAIANLPLALAPGMGANAFFAYDMVGRHGTGPLSYGAAIAAVMLEGALFMVLSAVGLRGRLARLIPRCVRLASAAGIGLFLAFTGLRGVGLVGPSPLTVVALSPGALGRPTFWLGSAGFCLAALCLAGGANGGLIYGVLLITAASWPRGTRFTLFPRTSEGDAGFAYFRRVVDFHRIRRTAGRADFAGLRNRAAWIPLLTLLCVDMLDTTGSMYSMAEYAGFADERGGFEREYRAYLVDGGATIVGTALGTATVTAFIESTAGIKEGGRTGLTAVTTGVLFVGAVFFAPVLTSVPDWAVGPAMVMVGMMMMMRMGKEIQWGDAREAAPAFLTMILMPMTYSISNGIIAGMGIHLVMHAYDYAVAVAKWVQRAREGRNQISAAAAVPAAGDGMP